MVKSYNEQFDISVKDTQTNQKIESILTPQGDYYLIVQHGQEFKVQVSIPFNHQKQHQSNNNEQQEKQMYAFQLFLDGQAVSGAKTFYKSYYLQAFHNGNGNYSKFLFSIPELTNDKMQDNLVRNQLKVGTITCKFFNTKQKIVKGKIQPLKQISKELAKTKNISEFQSIKRVENKKCSLPGISITKGEEYSIDIGQKQQKFIEKSYDPNSDTSIKYFVKYDEQIDEITLYYADFNYLLCMNYISLSNIEHYKYIPSSVLNQNKYLVQIILKTLLYRYPKMDLNKLEKSFKQYTQRTFKDVKIGNLADFLILKQDIFKFNAQNNTYYLEEGDKKTNSLQQQLQDLEKIKLQQHLKSQQLCQNIKQKQAKQQISMKNDYLKLHENNSQQQQQQQSKEEQQKQSVIVIEDDDDDNYNNNNFQNEKENHSQFNNNQYNFDEIF